MIEDFKNAGIFGMIQSGKTTLARKISLWFAGRGRPSIALDPTGDNEWGRHCTKFGSGDEQEKLFWETAWKNRGCLVIVDEAAATIRRDRDLVSVFTRLHHNDHKVLVIGHGGSDLLPVMRQQLGTVFLFRQSGDEAKTWSDNFTRPEILASQNLSQYEFMICTRYGTPRTYKLSPL